MQNFKIEAAIDLGSAAQVQALQSFLTAVHQDLVGKSELVETTEKLKAIPVVGAEEVKPENTAAKKASPAAEPKTKEEPKTQPEATEADTVDEPKTEAPAEDKSPIKIDLIRAEVSKKVTAHRDAIKKELTALGAANVTALPVDKYAEFLDFLNSLA